MEGRNKKPELGCEFAVKPPYFRKIYCGLASVCAASGNLCICPKRVMNSTERVECPIRDVAHQKGVIPQGFDTGSDDLSPLMPTGYNRLDQPTVVEVRNLYNGSL